MQIEIQAMAKEDESSAAMNRHLKPPGCLERDLISFPIPVLPRFLLNMNRERMEQEDELSLQLRQQDPLAVLRACLPSCVV